MAQAAVCHGPHRLPVLLMGAHIGVTGRPAGTDVEITPIVNGIRSVDSTGRPTDGRGATIRAFEVVFFSWFSLVTSVPAVCGSFVCFLFFKSSGIDWKPDRVPEAGSP